MRTITVIWGLALCGALMSCGESATGAADDVPSETNEPGQRSTTVPVRPPIDVGPEDDADLHLWVSNQSFVDDPVDITVKIDGVDVVHQQFAVEGQHNWIAFPIELPPGDHVVTATSETGVVLREEFRTPKDEDRHAVLDYWNYEDKEGRHFSWMIQRDPVAFM